MSTKATEIENQIAEKIADLQATYYGIAPQEARAYFIPGELVVVVLRETFTPAEKVLISHGDAAEIQHTRRRFQQLSREDFVAVVEQATGEEVETFLSETNLQTEVAVEIFLLAGKVRTPMRGFEESQKSDSTESRNPEQPE